MPRPILTDEEVLDLVTEFGLKLNFSHEQIAGMLKKEGRTPRQLLDKLEKKHRSEMRRTERNDHNRWLTKEAQTREEILQAEIEANERRRTEYRKRLTLPERVSDLLNAAMLAQEGTAGSSFDPKVSLGESDNQIPSLADKPLFDQVSDRLRVVIERAEEEVDRVVLRLPRRDRIERDRLILQMRGHASLVALRYGVSESAVRKLRAGADLNPTTGGLKEFKPTARAAA
jgi:hypothetical protein